VGMEGRVVIITGGASGLGKAAVEKFAGEGAIVYACDMNVEGLDNLKKEFSALPGKVIPKELNVTDRPAIAELISEIKSEFGHIDGLVNNAGVTRDALIQRMSEEDWEHGYQRQFERRFQHDASGCSGHDRSRSWFDCKHFVHRRRIR